MQNFGKNYPEPVPIPSHEAFINNFVYNRQYQTYMMMIELLTDFFSEVVMKNTIQNLNEQKLSGNMK